MKHFTPSYRPWRQRIAFVPDGDIFQGIASGKASVVSVLLSAGANAKAETTAEHLGIPAGSTPLSVASQEGHAGVAAALVGAGAT